MHDSLHKTLDEWQPGFELVGFGDELLDALLADGERGVRKFARVFLDLHAFQQAFQSVVSVGQALGKLKGKVQANAKVPSPELQSMVVKGLS